MPHPYLTRHPGIYAIVNGANQKVYIGSSKSLYSRWNSHRCELSVGHTNAHLQNAFNKNRDLFYVEVIEEFDTVNKKLLAEREQFWINFYQSHDRRHGYNKCTRPYSPCGAFFSASCRPILQFSLNGEFLRKFDSIKEAAGAICGGSGSNIGAAAQGIKRRMAHGFMWRYASENQQSNIGPIRPKGYTNSGPRGRYKKWVQLICKKCGKHYELQPHIAKGSDYCGIKCGFSAGGKKGGAIRGRQLAQAALSKNAEVTSGR